MLAGCDHNGICSGCAIGLAFVRVREGTTFTFVPGTPKEIGEGISSPDEIVAQLEAIHGRMSSPPQPVITPQGTQQTGEYGYQVVAANAVGQDTVPSPTGFTSRANAILNAINSNPSSGIRSRTPAAGTVSSVSRHPSAHHGSDRRGPGHQYQLRRRRSGRKPVRPRFNPASGRPGSGRVDDPATV